MSNRILTYGNLSTFATELKAKYAKQTALETLAGRVDNLVAAGGEPNVLEGVKVNGTALAIANKMVDLLVATGTSNGTIKVNNVDIAVAGLQALAYKAKVSEADLDTALKAVLDAKATGADLTALAGRVTTAEGTLTTLNGDSTVAGSVKQQVAAAVAQIVSDAPEAYDTLKEISDWISTHANDASSMNTQILANKNNIAALTTLVGTLPEGAVSTTVVGYIAEAIADIGIGDYAKTTEVASAISTALADYYTKTQIDNKLADYATTASVDTKLESYVKTADVGLVTEAEVQALLADK